MNLDDLIIPGDPLVFLAPSQTIPALSLVNTLVINGATVSSVTPAQFPHCVLGVDECCTVIEGDTITFQGQLMAQQQTIHGSHAIKVCPQYADGAFSLEKGYVFDLGVHLGQRMQNSLPAPQREDARCGEN